MTNQTPILNNNSKNELAKKVHINHFDTAKYQELCKDIQSSKSSGCATFLAGAGAILGTILSIFVSPWLLFVAIPSLALVATGSVMSIDSKKQVKSAADSLGVSVDTLKDLCESKELLRVVSEVQADNMVEEDCLKQYQTVESSSQIEGLPQSDHLNQLNEGSSIDSGDSLLNL